MDDNYSIDFEFVDDIHKITNKYIKPKTLRKLLLYYLVPDVTQLISEYVDNNIYLSEISEFIKKNREKYGAWNSPKLTLIGSTMYNFPTKFMNMATLISYKFVRKKILRSKSVKTIIAKLTLELKPFLMVKNEKYPQFKSGGWFNSGSYVVVVPNNAHHRVKLNVAVVQYPNPDGVFLSYCDHVFSIKNGKLLCSDYDFKYNPYSYFSQNGFSVYICEYEKLNNCHYEIATLLQQVPKDQPLK